MITVEEKPHDIVHTLNPVRYRLRLASPANRIMLTITANSFSWTGTYLSDASGKVTFDISEILHTLVFSNDAENAAMVYAVNGLICPVKINIRELATNSSTVDETNHNINCLYGGVDSQTLRYLHSINTNIFEYRLFNHKKQFLFTTRTSSQTIRMRRSELYPLYFFMPDTDITIASGLGNMLTISPGGNAGKLSALNLPVISEQFFAQYGEVVSKFFIIIDTICIFMITVLPDTPSVNRLILRFRNSLGCYEQIEVTGKAEMEPEFEDENSYNVYDDITGKFTENRFRREYCDTIKASAGYKIPAELNFIRELLSSDEIYLIDKIGKIKVHVTSEQYSMVINPVEPQTVELVIRYASKENLVTPSLLDTEDFPYGRGFFDQGVLDAEGYAFFWSLVRTI